MASLQVIRALELNSTSHCDSSATSATTCKFGRKKERRFLPQQETPPTSNRFNVRGSSGRFTIAKAWTAKRKLGLEDCSNENEPPSKRQTWAEKAVTLQEDSIPHGNGFIDLDIFHQR
ncbi:hypothetical protein OS493_029179 [Desmophyllum pertusum]|uniref:Uncharacterized protein n=1 Tax=Desmophyllum pertusum TaxID=174260 RepID=A0A9X0D9E3_9CNID|nr:hypothetical protein OS493_029179 [Desmophyllum pertusum]